MQNAEIYLRTNQLQYTEAKTFLDRCSYAGYLTFKDGERVLDVGCGPGDVTSDLLRPLLPSDASLVGVDLSREMVDYANNNFSSDRLLFRQADLEDRNMVASLDCGQFDKIFSFHCLQWIKNQRLAFENLRKLLKAGGSLFLVFISESNLNKLNDRLLCNVKWQRHLQVLEDFSPKLNIEGDKEAYFGTLLRELGFTVSECKLHHSQHTFTSIHQLCELVKALHPAVKEMSDAVLKEFMKDVHQTILKEKLGQLDPLTGNITAPHHIFTIVADKT